MPSARGRSFLSVIFFGPAKKVTRLPAGTGGFLGAVPERGLSPGLNANGGHSPNGKRDSPQAGTVPSLNPPKVTCNLFRVIGPLFKQPVDQLPVLFLDHMAAFFEGIGQLLADGEFMPQEMDLLQLLVGLEAGLGM